MSPEVSPLKWARKAVKMFIGTRIIIKNVEEEEKKEAEDKEERY